MACKSHAGGGDDDAEKRACAQPERAAIEVEVEATGGVNVQLGDRISRGQALGLAPDFSGPVVSPADGVVAAIGFNPTTHRFRYPSVLDGHRTEQRERRRKSTRTRGAS